jgi:nucleotide-binding universal stress UspA family protein
MMTIETTEIHTETPHYSERPVKFLVCVDGQSEAQVALRMACIKASKRGALVDILHVIEPAEAESLFGVSDMNRDCC